MFIIKDVLPSIVTAPVTVVTVKLLVAASPELSFTTNILPVDGASGNLTLKTPALISQLK